MNCTSCDQEIHRGEKYIAVTRQTEQAGRLGTVKVSDAELVAAYHPRCAPEKGRV